MKIGTCGELDYWRIGGDIWTRRNYAPPALDINGMPMDLRWECSVAHFERFRAIYNLEAVAV